MISPPGGPLGLVTLRAPVHSLLWIAGQRNSQFSVNGAVSLDQSTSPALWGAERGLEMCLGLSWLYPSKELGAVLVLQVDLPYCSPGPLVASAVNTRLGEGELGSSDKSTSCLLSHLGQAARSWGPTTVPTAILAAWVPLETSLGETRPRSG